MTEDIAISKISVGHRIVLGRDVCEKLNVTEGEKVTIYQNSHGEIAIRKTSAEAV